MSLSVQTRKGLSRYLIDADVPANALGLHVSELAPGAMAHPAHTHAASEAFYVLEGRAAVEIAGERCEFGPNEAIVLDARKPHAIANAGDTRLRYLVVIAGR